MVLKFTKYDFLIILSLSVPKFVVGFITSMVIPIFPSLIMVHFNNSLINFDSNVSFNAVNATKYNYRELSILFVVKNLCQIVAGPIIGFFIDSLGAIVLLLCGSIGYIATILFYGLGNAYYLLIIGRVLEAITSSAVSCATSAFVAIRFKDHKQRGFVFGISGLSLCIGSAIGPAYGGVVFQYYGKTTAFLSVLSFIFVVIILVISVIFMERNVQRKKCVIKEDDAQKKDYVSSMENVLPIPLTEILPTSTDVDKDEDIVLTNGESEVVVRLRDSLVPAEEKVKLDSPPSHNVLMFVKDPYFLISIGTIPVIFISVYMLFSTLPLYMSLAFHATESQQGIIWIVNIIGFTLGFVIGNIVNAKLASSRHIILMAYTILHGLGILCIPFMPVWWSIAIPLSVIVHVHLVAEVVMAPILATIVETRHASKFGIMSGIIIMIIAITASIGSFLGPILLSTIGFKYMNVAVAILSVLYSPFLLFLKRFSKTR